MVESVKKCDRSITAEESKDDSEQSDSEQSQDTVPVISSTSDRNDNINRLYVIDANSHHVRAIGITRLLTT